MGRRRTGLTVEWGKDVLRDADFSDIEQNIQSILKGVDLESVAVYLFLADDFARGSVTERPLFQFVYRSFYRLDNAGLTQEFKKKYFELMEAARGKAVDIRRLAEVLFDIPNAKGQKSLQFSFVTKLAHTVDPKHALYDENIVKYFRFRSPNGSPKDFPNRIQPFLPFYQDLSRCYQRILGDGTLANAMHSFRDTRSARVPDVKILDFIFHSAGRLGLSVGVPGIAARLDAAARK